MPEELPDIDDIAPPPAIPEPTGAMLWIVVAVAAAILVALFVWFLLRRSRSGPGSRAEYNARKSALDKLHLLKENAVATAPAHCALATTEALKEYLFNYHDPESPYSTTAEILRNLRAKRSTDAATLERIATLLSDCDRLKYARSETDVSAKLPLIEAAIAFVREDRGAQTPPLEKAETNAPAGVALS